MADRPVPTTLLASTTDAVDALHVHLVGPRLQIVVATLDEIYEAWTTATATGTLMRLQEMCGKQPDGTLIVEPVLVNPANVVEIGFATEDARRDAQEAFRA